MVLIRSKNVPRNQWNMGLITEAVKGSDGLVRRAYVKVCPTKGRRRVVEKAIHDLVLLCPEETKKRA